MAGSSKGFARSGQGTKRFSKAGQASGVILFLIFREGRLGVSLPEAYLSPEAPNDRRGSRTESCQGQKTRQNLFFPIRPLAPLIR